MQVFAWAEMDVKDFEDFANLELPTLP